MLLLKFLLKSELQDSKPKTKKGSCLCLKSFIHFIILFIAVGVYLYLYKKDEVVNYLKYLEKK